MALVKCKECKQDVSSSGTTCPGCGASSPGVSFVHKLGALVILGVVTAVGVVACGGGQEPTAATKNQTNSAAQQPAAKQWYEGGTLHQASGLDWHHGDDADKLATAADLIARLNNGGALSPEIASSIHNVDDLKPLAVELVVQLDGTFTPESETEQNQFVLGDQKVSTTSVMLMALMGWIKTGS